MLAEMLSHDSLPNVIRRQRDLNYRLLCGKHLIMVSVLPFTPFSLDFCSTTILFCSFFCIECGYETCRECHREIENSSLNLTSAHQVS